MAQSGRKTTVVHSIQHGFIPPTVKDLLEQSVQRLASRQGIRHAIVGIEPGDQSYRWIGSTGMADPLGTPMMPDTPYCIASITKLFTGAAILRLHEQRLLSLDDPLRKHLCPELLSGLHRYKGVDWTATLTLRHLLCHTSGLPDYLSESPKGKKTLLDLLAKEDDRSWDIAEVIQIVRTWKNAHFPPRPFNGRRHTARYSDTNFQLLLSVIEAVTDQPIHEVFATLFYKPLGLAHTWHPGSPAEIHMPAAAMPWVGDQPIVKPLAFRSFRDLFSTANDTLTFLRALVTGSLFDSPATAESMWQHWNPLAFSLIPSTPGWPIEYGLAMMRFKLPRFLSPWMLTPTLIGHTGASGSWLFYAPEADLYLTGTVDQLRAAALPFREVPKWIRTIQMARAKKP